MLLSLVNYRGSYGFGQDGIESLPGNIGSQDVLDVQVRTYERVQLVNVFRNFETRALCLFFIMVLMGKNVPYGNFFRLNDLCLVLPLYLLV